MIIMILILIPLIVGVIFFSQRITEIKVANVSVKRRIYPSKIEIGEECKIELTVSNENSTSIPFLIVEEEIPKAVQFVGNVVKNENSEKIVHISTFFLNRRQLRRRTYKLKGIKRGAYIIKNMRITVGSILGLSLQSDYASDFEELVVYPKIKELDKFRFDITSFQGDNAVRRWIHRDPTYIRGIREYTVNDRMKDIHWNASLKANKLMVKDYDFTAEEEMIIIVNIEMNSDYSGKKTVNEIIESEIDIAAALAWRASFEGISVGIWSNSQLISMEEEISNEINPSSGNFNKILEYCARMTEQNKYSFSSYIEKNISSFNSVYTYVFLAYYFDEEMLATIEGLAARGVRTKIIDVSEDGDIPSIRGVEKIVYRGNDL